MYCDEDYLVEKPMVLKKLMETAMSFSELSKCAAKKVCCILYKNGNIISLGLNGTSPGTVNCCEKFTKINGVWNTIKAGVISPCETQDDHYFWSLYNEIHAEMNAISKALVPVQGATAIVTHAPCLNCAKAFLAFGINRIYYKNKYDDFDNVFNFLKSQNIELLCVDEI